MIKETGFHSWCQSFLRLKAEGFHIGCKFFLALKAKGFHIGCKYLLTLREIGFEISHFTAGHNYDDHGFTAMKGLNLACR